MKHYNFTLFLDRTLGGGLFRQLSIFVFLILVVFASFWGVTSIFQDSMVSGEGDFGPFWNLIYCFTDTGFQAVPNVNHRGGAYIISFVGTVLLGGVLISTLSNIFERRVEKAEQGELRYRFKKHVVIIGYNETTFGLIKYISRQPEYAKGTILLQMRKDVSQIRRLLAAHLSDKVMSRLVIYHAMRDTLEEIQGLNLEQALELFILNEQEDTDSDSINMEAMQLVAQCCKNRLGEKLKCHVIFQNQTTVSMFQRADLAREIKASVMFYPVMYYDLLARDLLVGSQIKGIEHGNHDVEDKAIDYPPLDRGIITRTSEKYVHLVILGMSDMGLALGLQAAHLTHYANFEKRKTQITFIDAHAFEKMQEFMARHQSFCDVAETYFMRPTESLSFLQNQKNSAYDYLGDFVDIRFNFVEGDVEMPEVRSLLSQWSSDSDAYLTLAVCYHRTHDALAKGMFLPSSLYENEIPIFIYQRDSAAILQSLGEAKSVSGNFPNLYAQVYPFGMIKDEFNPKNKVLKWAQRANYVYNYYVQYKALPQHAPKGLAWENEVETPWRELSISNQWSNIFYAYALPTKLRGLGFGCGHLDEENPKRTHLKKRSDVQQASPKIDASLSFVLDEKVLNELSLVEHNRWVVEKLLAGFRPPTQEESTMVEHDRTKKALLKKYYVHTDLCSFERLRLDAHGNDVGEYDKNLIQKIPFIVGSAIQ